ncbi:D-isomer specific 2-hydroxyacid dehydrogenase family protein [Vaginisenegalia massiliensis]|uniref:D-isomer specific 2-hydroxyacid dehydrogenase family protein n=1 Tax=Vaginisenegalia massiliensis TaxID=2058294 RepID=UPI000F52884C|nr:D-isomer specific 2-hydroxyacid dehydrogenase family protein [Vaginisenegalia massiliensis]
MTKNKIAIVNSSSFGKIFPHHISQLKKIGEVNHFRFDQDIPGKDLAEALNGYNMIISSVTPFFTQEFFEHKDELKIISRHGIGFNNIDLEAARKHNTIVSIIPALVERDAVAEQNITNLLNVMRKVSQSTARVKEDKWSDRACFVGHSLYNKTVGIIGIGNTGSCVAQTLRYGFRCRVISYDPNKSSLDMAQFGAEKVSFEELLNQSDVICLTANLTKDSYHMIDQKAISQMKNHVYISNSARGALVDEEAIITALESGKIAGYATDVLESEPGSKDHPYLSFDNVIMTPHTAAYTMECLEAMGDKCVQDIEDMAQGKLPVRSIQAESCFIK